MPIVVLTGNGDVALAVQAMKVAARHSRDSPHPGTAPPE